MRVHCIGGSTQIHCTFTVSEVQPKFTCRVPSPTLSASHINNFICVLILLGSLMYSVSWLIFSWVIFSWVIGSVSLCCHIDDSGLLHYDCVDDVCNLFLDVVV